MSLNLAALSRTAVPADDATDDGTRFAHQPQPTHWDPDWQHRPLRRATEDVPRQPLISQPENLKDDTPDNDRRLSEIYWRDTLPSVWDELCETVANGMRLRKRPITCDIALFPATSGLVVLDCDVKHYDPETAFVRNGNAMSLAPAVVKRGIDDLRREVEALGHSMSELATYMVRTKSGGFHLYYRENPQAVLHGSGHRDEWRVDVIAHNSESDRSWVAAPPTPGYEVVRDLPVMQMPLWLAQWLTGLSTNLPPVGREKRQQLTREAADYRGRVLAPEMYNGSGTGIGELLHQWVRAELAVVQNANQVGGWNLAIYQCVLNLLDGGWEIEGVEQAVLDAAQPVDSSERRKAMDTVHSAHKRYVIKTYGR